MELGFEPRYSDKGCELPKWEGNQYVECLSCAGSCTDYSPWSEVPFLANLFRSFLEKRFFSLWTKLSVLDYKFSACSTDFRCAIP